MSSIVYILVPLLAFSVLLNIFFVWYGSKLINDFYFLTNNLRVLMEEVLLFADHLRAVHDMEMFYGDATLDGLIRQLNGLIETLDDFVEIVETFEEAEEAIEETEIDDTEDRSQETS